MNFVQSGQCSGKLRLPRVALMDFKWNRWDIHPLIISTPYQLRHTRTCLGINEVVVYTGKMSFVILCLRQGPNKQIRDEVIRFAVEVSIDGEFRRLGVRVLCGINLEGCEQCKTTFQTNGVEIELRQCSLWPPDWVQTSSP
jgi:hypothetical protein